MIYDMLFRNHKVILWIIEENLSTLNVAFHEHGKGDNAHDITVLLWITVHLRIHPCKTGFHRCYV